MLKVDCVPVLDVPGIEFLSLAKGYGVEGVRAAKANHLEQALAAALGSQAPTLIEVPTLAEGILREFAVSTKPVNVEEYRIRAQRRLPKIIFLSRRRR